MPTPQIPDRRAHHPLVASLLAEIPMRVTSCYGHDLSPPWSAKDRERWFNLARAIFDRVYGDGSARTKREGPGGEAGG